MLMCITGIARGESGDEKWLCFAVLFSSMKTVGILMGERNKKY